MLRLVLAEEPQRMQHIDHYQQLIWAGIPRDAVDTATAERLRDLALDLDYYEPDENLRAESDVYYGDDKLVDLIRPVLFRLEGHTDP